MDINNFIDPSCLYTHFTCTCMPTAWNIQLENTCSAKFTWPYSLNLSTMMFITNSLHVFFHTIYIHTNQWTLMSCSRKPWVDLFSFVLHFIHNPGRWRSIRRGGRGRGRRGRGRDSRYSWQGRVVTNPSHRTKKPYYLCIYSYLGSIICVYCCYNRQL